MVQLSQVPLFRGDGSQDAEKWQQDFLLATAQFNDQAIARLFISKLARGSPAAEYINTLPSNTRASWLELDSAFQAKWLSGSTPDTNLGNRWDEFESHILTEESIFHGASSMDDGLTFDQRVLIWADDHIRLGKATGGSDESLIRLTKSRLPLFVLTALSMSPPPTSFTDFCDSITQIPPDILEMHRVQHQDHSSREARLSAIEKTLEGISTKIDRLLKGDSNIPVLAHGDSSDDRVAQPGHTHIDSPANELRSPIPSSGIPEAIMVNIPSQWRKPEMNLSKLEQIGVAQRAIDELMRHATNQHDFNGLSDAQTAGAWAVLAIHSQFVPLTKDNKNKMEQALLANCPKSLPSDPRTHSGRMQWALAFCYGYRTLGKQPIMQGAIDYWTEMSQGCMFSCYHSKPDANSKDKVNTDDIHFTRGGVGKRSLCGGVFVAKDRVRGIGSFQTTTFMALSALLASRTGERKYKEAAILSAQCVQAAMIDSATSLVKDCFYNIFNQQEDDDSRVSCFLTGVFIEGLSTLALVTQDQRWKDLARDTANAVMDLKQWHEKEGILAPVQRHTPRLFNVAASKGVLIRGICGAYTCNLADPAFQGKVRAYINVQYNALRDLARIAHSYSLDWAGPSDGPSVIAQVAALDVLVAAIVVNDNGRETISF